MDPGCERDRARTRARSRCDSRPLAPPGMMARMDDRPWLASYPSDVPTTLAPYPEVSLFSLLEASARRFGRGPALAFFGKHMAYSALLSEVERFSAALA